MGWEPCKRGISDGLQTLVIVRGKPGDDSSRLNFVRDAVICALAWVSPTFR